MSTIKVVPNQSWTDLALEGYGNVDALMQLLNDNVLDETDTDLAAACGLTTVTVDDISDLVNKTALRAMGGATIATLK